MRTKRLARRWPFAAMILIGAMSGPVLAQDRQALPTQHLREEARAGRSLGTLPKETVLRFDMMLPPSAPEELDRFLNALYDPGSGSYRRFVTPAEFTARFGPTQAAWDELVSFAQEHGFTIIGGSRDEMDLRLTGSVRAIEAAFHVTMRLYQHPTEPRLFYSPDAEPTVDMRNVVWHISGLDNFSTPHPRVHARSGFTVKPLTATGACPGGSYCGSDMRAAYYGAAALTGTGQTVGLVEFYGYDVADLNTYFRTSGQSNSVPVNGISIDGSPLGCVYANGCDDTEQTLDITQAIGMAPGLAQVNVYVGGSDTAILSAMSVPAPGSATGKVDAQLSCSWGWGPADPGTDDPLFKKFAAQGQSFFVAAGDSAAYSRSSQDVYPADDAYVTVVGGTDLSTAGPGGAWLGETAWSDGGGGYLSFDAIAIPAWQTAAIASFNARSSKQGSTVWRNSPDVAGEANFDFYVCADQQACTANMYGGTSFAAPMWAGYMALVNEQASQNGQAAPGFVNPALYVLGDAAGSGYTQAFHDVTAGNNGYAALAGYDLATGWGSPNGAGLIAALLGSQTSAPAFYLAASAGSLSVTAGSSGSLTLSSSASGGFAAPITLSVSGLPAGVTAGFSTTSMSAPGTATLTVTVGSSATAGSYPLAINAVGGNITRTLSVTLVVVSAPKSSFGISVAASALVVTHGKSSTYTVQTVVSGSAPPAITLAIAGLPAGVTARFSPVTLTGSGQSTLTLNAASTARRGTQAVTISGTAGATTHSSTLNLTVN